MPRLLAALVLLFVTLAWSDLPSHAATPAAAVAAARPQASCTDGNHSVGKAAIYRICMPPAGAWNGNLVVFAHGYVAPNRPVAIPEDQLVTGGQSIPDAATALGYAFATTSYRQNGLAVREGLEDLVDLVRIFKEANPGVQKVYLLGASMGGLISSLAAERYPQVFNGAAAFCSPNGSFLAQINYWGDFRVVFDYFFPGLMPGSATEIPADLISGWEAHFSSVILPAITQPTAALSLTQVISVTGAPINMADPASVISTTYSILWYNVFATNDAVARLGGQPFDNQSHVYKGALNDTALNAGVKRFSADPQALLSAAAFYETTGRPQMSLVSLHTTLDPVAPYFHAERYLQKLTATSHLPRYQHTPVQRYGHCAFTAGETQAALFALLTANPPALNLKLYTPIALN